MSLVPLRLCCRCGQAIKFTAAGGHVDVVLRSLPPPAQLGEAKAAVGFISVSVTDSGVGIPAASLQRIFQPFFQADGSSDAGRQGVGLGLSIVKSVVELHGGLISVQSQQGAGTRFDILLPARRTEADAAAASVSSLRLSGFPLLAATSLASSGSDVVTGETRPLHSFCTPPDSIGVDQAVVSSWAQRAAASSSSADQKQQQSSEEPQQVGQEWDASVACTLSVLVVDDSAINRRLLVRLLQSAGITRTAQAADGRAALQALERLGPFSVVLLDLNMPVLDGWETLAEMRRRQLSVPVVALTASRDSEDERRCRELGVQGQRQPPALQPLLCCSTAHPRSLSEQSSCGSRSAATPCSPVCAAACIRRSRQHRTQQTQIRLLYKHGTQLLILSAVCSARSPEWRRSAAVTCSSPY